MQALDPIAFATDCLGELAVQWKVVVVWNAGMASDKGAKRRAVFLPLLQRAWKGVRPCKRGGLVDEKAVNVPHQRL